MVQVEVIEATPNPERLVCLAARGDYMESPPWKVPFDEVMKPVAGKSTPDKVEHLVKKLMNAGHWGPFEHPVITLGFDKLSRVTLAQVTRHRIATFDIQSAREVSYSSLTSAQLIWPPSFTEGRAKSRKEGAREITISKDEREKAVKAVWEAQLALYRRLVEGGVPAEDARYVLPLATPVHGTASFNARSLMHVIAIRTFGDAQWEIRQLAASMLELAKKWMPVTFAYFESKFMKERSILAP
jgi:thymidylate synthase (FAD)